MGWDTFTATIEEAAPPRPVNPYRYRAYTTDDVEAIREVARVVLPMAHDSDGKIEAKCPLSMCSHKLHTSQRKPFFVNLTNGRAVGTWKCNRCGASGHWNGLCEQLGIEPMEPQQDMPVRVQAIEEVGDRVFVHRADGRLRDWTNQTWMRTTMQGEYTGITIPAGPFRALGAKLYNWGLDEWAAIPVYDGDEVVGSADVMIGVRYPELVAKQHTSKNLPNRIVPAWLKQVAAAYHHDYVVLVEGQSDCLRLLGAGVPSLPLLGATALSARKASRIAQVYPHIYVSLNTDANGAGQKGTANAVKVLDEIGASYTVVAQELGVDFGGMQDDELEDFIRRYFR